MKQNESAVIVVKAFFKESGIEYRHYQLKKAIKTTQIEKLLTMARGKADLSRRTYSVSKSAMIALSQMADETIEWDVTRFFYDVGVYEGISSIPPDGFLLTRRSSLNGSVLKHYVAKNSFDLAQFLLLTDQSQVLSYQSIYLGTELSPDALLIFPALMEPMHQDETYFELTPILRAHVSYYLREHNLKINS
jgi:hypothetical protein